MKYVAGFMFNADLTRVALIRKMKPEWQRGLLNGIGGKIEDGEEPMDAMAREFMEEVGCTWQEPWIPYGELTGPGFAVYLFACRGKLEMIASQEEEKIEIIEVNFIHLSARGMVENLAWIIALAIDVLTDGRPHYVSAVYP